VDQFLHGVDVVKCRAKTHTECRFGALEYESGRDNPPELDTMSAPLLNSQSIYGSPYLLIKTVSASCVC
jgi:hypothetical protein